MTDPQAWTLIGVFAAAILGGLTLVTTMLTRVIRAEIGGLRSEVGGQIQSLRGEVTGQIKGLRGEVAGLHTRFDSLEKRVDNLDRDVQAITDRLWRRDRDA